MRRRLKTNVQDPALEALLRDHYQHVPQAEAHVDQWIAKVHAGSPGHSGQSGVRTRVWTAGALVAVGGLAGIVLHWAPRVDALAWAAARNTPVLNRLTESLSLPGISALVGTQKVIPLAVTDRHDGVTVQVVGAYADAAQTLVFLRTTRGMAVSPQQITLRDQFGEALYPNTAAWNNTTHEGYVDFSALPSWVWTPGVRFTLALQSLGTAKNPSSAVYPGPWQLTWDQAPPGASRTIVLHARTQVHGVTFALHRILLAPSAAVLTLSSSTPQHLSPATAKWAKARGPQFAVERTENGQTVPILSGSGGGTQFTLMSGPLLPGHYILKVLWWNRTQGPWTLPFTMPPGHH